MKTKIQVSGVKVGAEGSVVSDLSRVKRPKPSGSQAQQRLKRVREMLAAKRAKESNTKDNSKDNSRGSDDGNGQSICTRNGSEMPAAKTRSKPARANLQQATPGLSNLQRKMQQKLKGARFRWINETLYTTTGDKALEMVQGDPGIFEEYHQGFSSQVEKWPVNPVDIFIKQLQACKPLVVADMGCGEAKLAAVVGKVHTVHSFDLVAYNSLITPCNIADVPLVDSSVDVAIFCLALMGTDFIKFIREANRILRTGGQLKIAEVVSRISDVGVFVSELELQGFELKHEDCSNKMFIMLEFVKTKPSPAKMVEKHGLLKPCIYKRR
ncbi:25S rRNA (adenine645-N1)-methyltransferase [Coemansia asiatica]|uniref:Ribosomal RNA-processing protein 8 n=1 Tax=Coemansia asiatica TaxID=1052880 RepID=A0A9W7XMZ0_9FUNG|nr:25S rRNA (adenine645-N1)-methyltransferase [Coemansia asiatica]